MAKVVGSYEFQVIIILVGAGEVSLVRHGGYGLQTYITLWDPNLFKQKFGSTSTSTELTSGGGTEAFNIFLLRKKSFTTRVSSWPKHRTRKPNIISQLYLSKMTALKHII
jgi:hypothetical protein